MSGLKWITGQVITFNRMNQKTLIVQAAEPAVMYPGMPWFDIDDNKLKQRNAANNAWIERPGITLAATISGLWTFDRGANPPFAINAAATRVANLLAALHASEHENAGADEIGVGGLSGLLADDQHVLDAEVLLVAAALVHASRHENAGADEISVAGLSGLLADDQHVLDAEVLLVAAALVHAARHKDGGADELDVSELAGAIGAAGEIPETDGDAVTWVEPDGRYDPKAHVLATTGPHTGTLPDGDIAGHAVPEVLAIISCSLSGPFTTTAGAAAVVDYTDFLLNISDFPADAKGLLRIVWKNSGNNNNSMDLYDQFGAAPVANSSETEGMAAGVWEISETDAPFALPAGLKSFQLRLWTSGGTLTVAKAELQIERAT